MEDVPRPPIESGLSRTATLASVLGRLLVAERLTGAMPDAFSGRG
jgi:hypothetical protein